MSSSEFDPLAACSFTASELVVAGAEPMGKAKYTSWVFNL
jgi:hypothetical protein